MESIAYWKKHLNEAVDTNTGDTVKEIIKKINDEFTYISNAIDKASDEEYNVIDKVIAWDDTSKMLGMAIYDLIKLFGYEQEFGYK